MYFLDFTHARDLFSFFENVGYRDNEFDVTDLPQVLWPNLYLLSVGASRELTIRIAGEGIQQWFNRPIRGLDLRTIVHGEAQAGVLEAYDQAIDQHDRLALRRVAIFPRQNLTRVIECAIAPLVKDGVTTRIIGCLYLETFDYQHPSPGTDQTFVFPWDASRAD